MPERKPPPRYSPQGDNGSGPAGHPLTTQHSKHGTAWERPVYPGASQGPADAGQWWTLLEAVKGLEDQHRDVPGDGEGEGPSILRRVVDDLGRVYLAMRVRIQQTQHERWFYARFLDIDPSASTPADDDGDTYFICPSDDTIQIYIGGSVAYIFNGTDLSIPASGNIQVNGVDPYGTATCRAEGLYPSTTSGCADPVLYETSSNKQNIYLADFDGASTEYAEFPLSMPDGWDGGTFRFRFKFAFTDVPSAPGSTVIWGAQMLAYGDRDNLDAAWGSAQEVTYTNTGSETGKYMVSDWTSAVTPAGTPAAGEDVQVRIYRDGGTDTTNVDARFRMVQVDFQRSAFSD